MLRRSRLLTPIVVACCLTCLPACGEKTPLQPVNHSPVVESLIAFPATISPGDSAVVVCHATDPDGDRVVFDWYLAGPLLMQGYAYNQSNAKVVYAQPGSGALPDTGWVSCEARDSRGGGAYAGRVLIIIRQ